ncbi:WDR55 [Cordylochernes scorpioides]|uniref:WD repeat-containing protein 55 homolog n=1 Tax=Cordylochernes scorpioides TaxID=51811 RepID=A0ABY6K300_9ARAC|nr:WDR55 [Cordylochernes scorpioides]
MSLDVFFSTRHQLSAWKSGVTKCLSFWAKKWSISLCGREAMYPFYVDYTYAFCWGMGTKTCPNSVIKFSSRYSFSILIFFWRFILDSPIIAMSSADVYKVMSLVSFNSSSLESNAIALGIIGAIIILLSVKNAVSQINNNKPKHDDDSSDEDFSSDSDSDNDSIESDKPESSEKLCMEIELDDTISDISMHPKEDKLCISTLDGKIFLYSYSIEDGEANEIRSWDKNKGALVKFSDDGSYLFVATRKKKSSIKIYDPNSGNLKCLIKDDYDSKIFSLLPIDDYLVAAGYDDGYFKVWDYRKKTCIMEDKQCEDFISSLCTNTRKKIILATSGEGTLTAFDIRKKKMEVQSELFDSELLSAAFVKKESKLIVGTGEGVINIFNKDEWGNISDRFPVTTDSIDCLVPITEDVIAAGSSDGSILAINILPNKVLGPIGNHGGMPIVSLAISHDKNYIASSSHDSRVKIFDVSSFKEVPKSMLQGALVIYTFFPAGKKLLKC